MLQKIAFRTVKYSDLQQVVRLQDVADLTIFQEWFNFSYTFLDAEIELFNHLIQKYRRYFPALLEDEIKSHFIIPLIDSVNFWFDDIRDFLGHPLRATINGVEIGGTTDFMVAKGEEDPEIPYFFLQEFKKEDNAPHPKNQLLAEMLVAIQLNQTNLIRGSYIIGRYWHFVILEKNEKSEYNYYISDSLDALNINSLKQIYSCLQAVKLLYCKH